MRTTVRRAYAARPSRPLTTDPAHQPTPGTEPAPAGRPRGRHRAAPPRGRALAAALLAVLMLSGLVATDAASSRGRSEASAALGTGPVVMQMGSRGPMVAELQRLLGVYPNGIYRSTTFYAVLRWQRIRGYVKTGKVDTQMWAALHPRPGVPLSVQRLNWRALSYCESSGNPRAVSPAGYYGLYQFNVTTWRSVGGTGMPNYASSSEQTYRAQLLYVRRGASPWPVCGRRLFS